MDIAAELATLPDLIEVLTRRYVLALDRAAGSVCRDAYDIALEEQAKTNDLSAAMRQYGEAMLKIGSARDGYAVQEAAFRELESRRLIHAQRSVEARRASDWVEVTSAWAPCDPHLAGSLCMP